MPIPRPKQRETKEQFFDRCMSNGTMNDEYPDEKQRFAVCNSLWEQEEKGDRNMEQRKALPIHHTDTSTGSWDGPKNKARLKNDGDEAYYKKAHAWQDPDKDPKTKEAYKFIHHEVDGEGNIGPANIKACQSGIGILNGGRGGADIPDADRRGVYNHLAAHIKDAGLEPPELKSYEEIERRFSQEGLEIRTDEGKPAVLTGYASVWEKLSVPILFGFREKVRKGAFSESISRGGVRALWNHNSDSPLGNMKRKTLFLEEDDRGLRFELELPDSPLGETVKVAVKRGDAEGVSFGFKVRKDEWNETDPKNPIRTLVDVDLMEISPCVFPAYPQTSVKVRSVVMESGLDFDALSGLFFRAQRGLPITATDRDLINASIELLQSYLPSGSRQGPGPAADGDKPQGRLILLRKRLELLEKAI